MSDMINIQPCGMKGAVLNICSQEFGLSVKTPLPDAVFPFHDHGYGAASHDHSVSALVKGFCRFLYGFFNGRGAYREETGGDPFVLDFCSGSFTAYDDDPFTPAHPDPVLGDTCSLCCGGARGIELRVRPLGLYILGEEGGPHLDKVHEEVSVVLILFMSLYLFLKVEEPIRYFLLDPGIGDRLHEEIVKAFKVLIDVLIELVLIVSVYLVDEGLEAGENGREDNTCSLLHLFGERIPLFDQASGCGLLVVHHKGYSRVLERFNTRGYGKPVGDIIVIVDAIVLF